MSSELIASWLSRPRPHAWFDIDGTITCPELQVIAAVVSDGVASDGVVEMFKEHV